MVSAREVPGPFAAGVEPLGTHLGSLRTVAIVAVSTSVADVAALTGAS